MYGVQKKYTYIHTYIYIYTYIYTYTHTAFWLGVKKTLTKETTWKAQV